ncbi:hypothetical protein GGR95_003149 [Sulfitobacter undariae]|uniref:Lipoprotein n=1 Tax=Sulfitobacter undariae TaxID=1563671 RepID=A0A7W6H262_9RHOB|nr:hypothetical protein [Sulfitobacter undariae]MBB3995493.1 hypothetical protein [Sulfitobacter undariae]
MRLIPVAGILLSLAACGDPLAGVARLADVDVVDTNPAAVLPDREELAREGFIGTTAAEGTVPTQVAAAQSSDTSAMGGFFRGLVKRAAAADPAAAVAADVAQGQAEPSTKQPAVEPEHTVLAGLPAEPEAPKRKFGLFGGGRAAKKDAPRVGPDALDVPFGTLLPFGEIARVCEARGKPMGQKVDGNGKRGFSLYDSNAGGLGKRTYYLTGFSDNCPRQFTAANALLGKPSFYEQIRFGPAGENLPVATTDVAYEKVKKSICGTGKGKPCGSKIEQLDSNTVFLTAYENIAVNGTWKEFLVHNGTVLAAAVKSVN